MLRPTIYAPCLCALLVTLAGCADPYAPGDHQQVPPVPFTTFAMVGDSAAVAAKLAEFRVGLGGTINAPNSPPADSGRREINWDGVPAALTDVDTFPALFFNSVSKRGAEYVTPGTGLRVDSSSFAAVQPALADQFRPFSGKKLFMPVGSNSVDVVFRLAGTSTAATVKGFGAVFIDVDRANSTTIEYFDADGQSIGVVAAPSQGGTKSIAFVGAVFEAPVVARVRIRSGDAALAGSTDVTAGGAADLVVMDDFIFGEPRPAGPPALVTVGNDFFRSVHNLSENPAVDTISAGSTVTWTWAATGPHGIQSLGQSPEVFLNSVTMSAAGSAYTVRFKHPGTYNYQCSVHGAAMSGRVVVR